MMVVWLVHWDAAEARERLDQLETAGYAGMYEPGSGSPLLRRIRERGPAAVVIDLTRLPSHGREIALAIRESKKTRHIPLVFVEGDREKVRRIRALLPDATYGTWRGIRGTIGQAIRSAPRDPLVPKPYMARFAGTPLLKKLGIGPGARVGLLGAPDDVASILGELPSGTHLAKGARGACDPILCFVRSRKELDARLARLMRRADLGGVWLIWPKKSSGTRSDLSQALVRKAGLDAGLVDHKICAIDATWSGLRFVRRR